MHVLFSLNNARQFIECAKPNSDQSIQASDPSISLRGAASWQLQTAVLLTVLNIHRYMDVDATTMATKRELFSPFSKEEGASTMSMTPCTSELINGLSVPKMERDIINGSSM